MNKHYDIILVFVFSRIHNYYLNIVKYLSPELKIGIFVPGAEKAKWTSETNQLFLDFCRETGADVFYEGNFSCELLLVPQFRGADFLWGRIKNCITFKKAVSMQSFGLGAEFLKEYVENGIKKHFVYDRIVFQNKLKTDESRQFVNENLEIAEMGCPDLKYPVFPDFKCDYMAAFPTALSFTDSRSKTIFLENIISLLSQIPPEEHVVIKLHNVRDGGNPIDSGRIFDISSKLNPSGDIFKAGSKLASFMSKAFAFKFINLYNGFLYSEVLFKTAHMDKFTKYYNFGIELFLPGVKKGFITGRTSSVWYALYDKIPVYNCDNETKKARSQNVLDSYKSFGVPPCKGELRFNPENFNKINNSAVGADLIKILKKELEI